jgi:hypothetical protein
MLLINRFKRAVQAGRNAAAEPLDTIEPCVAALVIGQGYGELAAACAWLRATPSDRAILITDAPSVEHYQHSGLVTEFLPTGRILRDQSVKDPARNLYVQRRLAVIFTKWTVSRCAVIGPEAETLLSALAARAGRAADFPARAKAPVG